MIDGIVAGEGQGPFCPTSKNGNTLIAGTDLLATDIVAVRYMGLDSEKISYLKYFLTERFDGVALDNINIVENGKIVKDYFDSGSPYLDFYVVDLWKDIKIH